MRKGSISTPLGFIIQIISFEEVTTGQTSGRIEHHGKLHVLISAKIREHKLAGQTLLLA
jgi:hypothetical protein